MDGRKSFSPSFDSPIKCNIYAWGEKRQIKHRAKPYNFITSNHIWQKSKSKFKDCPPLLSYAREHWNDYGTS